MSLATITHACDTIEIDDYLEPFELPVVPTVSKDRPKPERDNYGQVLVGTDRRTSFGKGDYFVIDRGSDHGVEVGAQFVVYRDKKQAENFLFEIGEAVAVEVKAETCDAAGHACRATRSSQATTSRCDARLRRSRLVQG